VGELSGLTGLRPVGRSRITAPAAA